jgi:hypothetical protein
MKDMKELRVMGNENPVISSHKLPVCHPLHPIGTLSALKKPGTGQRAPMKKPDWLYQTGFSKVRFSNSTYWPISAA